MNMEIATNFEAVKFIGTHGRFIGQVVTICLEGLADVAAFYWLTTHEYGGKQSITYHLYIFGTINSNFKSLRRLKNVLTGKI
jgi:hypothetical protein